MNAPRPRRAVVALLAVGLVGCAAKKHDLVVRSGPDLSAPPTRVALAPAVLVHAEQLTLAPDGAAVRDRPLTSTGQDGALMDIDEATPEEAELLDIFYRNLYVGKVWMGGGYDMLPAIGNQVRSLALTFSLRTDYAAQAQSWADQTLADVLGQRELVVDPLPTSVEAALTAPAIRTIRGSGPLDGHDNQNLPRIELTPAALDPSALPQGIDAPVVLVPMIVHYYAHNGGWFVGQAEGCPAGARVRLLWVLHDTGTGAVLTWGDVSARYVEKYFYSPNDVQLQDYLLAAEGMIRGALEEGLLD